MYRGSEGSSKRKFVLIKLFKKTNYFTVLFLHVQLKNK